MNIWEFPAASRETAIGVLIGFLLMFAAAVVLDYSRRRSQRKARVQAGWALVREKVRESDLSEKEWETLRELIRRESPNDPDAVVTTRRRFNDCVSSFCGRIQKTAEMKQFMALGNVLRDVRLRLSLDYIPHGQRIETTRELWEGQIVLASRSDDERKRWSRWVVSGVDEALLWLEPRESAENATPAPEPGTVYQCRIWRQDDARYNFKLRCALEREGHYGFYHADELQRIQSREHFRVRHNQPATLEVLSVAAEEEDPLGRPAARRVRGRITSLSAGGFACEAYDSVNAGGLVRVSLSLGSQEPQKAAARVVACTPLAAGRYLIRASFLELGHETSEAIARYVWRRQQPLSQEKDAE